MSEALTRDEVLHLEGLETRPIFERITAIIGELPAIGKDRYNEQQKFAFRGIEDIMNALKPLLAKHGVFVVPDVLERIGEERQTQRGNSMWTVHLHVRFTFYATDGSSVCASGWGEGTDTGDKATNKAMTSAFKYVLGQVFAVSDAAADSDETTPEATTSRCQGPERRLPDVTDDESRERGYKNAKDELDANDYLREVSKRLTDEQRALVKENPAWERRPWVRADIDIIIGAAELLAESS